MYFGTSLSVEQIPATLCIVEFNWRSIYVFIYLYLHQGCRTSILEQIVKSHILFRGSREVPIYPDDRDSAAH